ncbi:Methyltransferase-like protein 7B [Araneus ventricosus]|uniref:Methyltransferase-like protein 7B n=1 Tax=Araneus ventricosus TaxID=182803 RepID=A0A4Y1ZLI9_ARAVE|nr:Methyltransferase-like protein 7B [Araneus ventricosus]GBL56553.1 Methyltransferase-like protein 7B [Araneus ventricosus]
MISVIYIFFCCLWWFLSLTVGLPLTLALLFSLSFRSLFFAWANSNIFEPFARAGFDVARKKAFRKLQDELNHTSEPLEVLEIGIGHGPNLRFYPENYNLTALDKNENMKPYFLKNLKRFSHIPYRGFVIQRAENMKDIPDASFDVVVSTYLHCSTHDSDAVLREIKRVLKPVSISSFSTFLILLADNLAFLGIQILKRKRLCARYSDSRSNFLV